MDCSPPLLLMEFSRQEYLSGVPFPPPGDLPDPGIKPTSLMSPALAGGFFITSTTWEAQSRNGRYRKAFVLRSSIGSCSILFTQV